MSTQAKRSILMLNGGYNEIPLIEAAHRLGFHVITSGNDPTGPGHALADEYRGADYSDKDAVLELARATGVEAICAASNDFAALSAAYAAEALGLPGHDSYATSRLFHEKDEFRRFASELNLSVPQAACFSDADDAVAYAHEQARFPLMVKPVDLSGGKGISRVDGAEAAEAAVRAAFERSKAKRVVLEDYVDGTQHGFICYIEDGKVAFDYSTNDFPSPVNPWLVGASFGHPATGYEAVRGSIIRDVELFARESKAADGFLTIQYAMSGGRPYYLETMRRCLGNLHFCALSRETGADWPEWFIASQAGLPCDDYIDRCSLGDTAAGFVIPFAERNGTIARIDVDERLERSLFRTEWLLRVGDRIDDFAQDKVAVMLFACPTALRDELLADREGLVRVVCE